MPQDAQWKHTVDRISRLRGVRTHACPNPLHPCVSRLRRALTRECPHPSHTQPCGLVQPPRVGPPSFLVLFGRDLRDLRRLISCALRVVYVRA